MPGIPQAILKQARKSGFLNLSSRELEVVPAEVWRLNAPPSSDGNAESFDADERWWEQVELTKLNLSSNQLTQLSEEIINFPALSVLDVHDNKLTSLPNSIRELPNLKRLDLSHNCLESISSLESLNVVVVLLHYNKLTELPSTLGSMDGCESLDVSHNKIASLPSSINSMRRLRSLNASYNHLTTLPLMDNLQHLTMLNLNNNDLKALPDSVQQLKNLEQLHCRNNSLSKLPPLKQCVRLKEVYLGNNALKSVPADMPDCISIFELRDNKISIVPVEITFITQLERLDIANNDISKLPPEIGNMQNIKVLVLDGNPLRSIRRDIVSQGTQAVLKHLKSRIVVAEELKNEKTQSSVLPQSETQSELTRKHNISSSGKLDLSRGNAASVEKGLEEVAGVQLVDMKLCRCGLTSLPSTVFSFGSSLTALNVSSNKIKDIPASIGQLTLITHLDISSNACSNLPNEMSNLKSLIELNISSNRFTSLPSCIYQLSSLEHLLADSNQVVSIDVVNLKKLTKLATLSLQNNSIGQVPPELALMERLQALKLEGNVFRVPRQSIVQKGSAAVLEYLRSRVPN